MCCAATREAGGDLRELRLDEVAVSRIAEQVVRLVGEDLFSRFGVEDKPRRSHVHTVVLDDRGRAYIKTPASLRSVSRLM